MSRTLSRKLIAQEALSLMGEEGIGALSMRKLGTRLGVEAMSLYHHVANKNDLLNAIHESLLENLRLPDLQDNWQHTAEATVKAFVQLLREHPQAIPLFASRSAIAPGSLGFVDASVGVFLEAGYEPAQALMAFQTLFTFAVGHAIYHYGPRDSQSFASAEEYARYPRLAQLASPTMNTPEQELDFGLQALLRGFHPSLR